MKVAIDGPAGAGKTTQSKALVRSLRKMNMGYIDTGAMYRAVGLCALRSNLQVSNTAGIKKMLSNCSIVLTVVGDENHIYLNGEDVSQLIRTPEVSKAASDFSAIPMVRNFLLQQQRDLAATGNWVMEGRDIGTVVLPDAEVKIFLTATPEVRAKRRHLELLEKGSDVDFDTVMKEMQARDKNDSERAVAPLKPADGSIVLDTTNMDFDEVQQLLTKTIKQGGAHV